MNDSLAAWDPSSLAPTDAAFAGHRLVELTGDFLTAWRNQNYGQMTTFVGRMFSPPTSSDGQLAGMLRSRFDGFRLETFEIRRADNEVPAIWIVSGDATVNGHAGDFSCRWSSLNDDSTVEFDVATAKWKLVFCDPTIIWHRNDQ